MRKRNFDEMISYFNCTLADMDIDQKYKMTLLGIVMAIGQEHEWTKPVLCKDCKHNPKDTWFGCPMAHLNEKQRPETAWCWRGERKNNG